MPVLVNKYTTFLRNVRVSGFDAERCWEWTGATKGNGYGNARRGTRNIPAHRLSYELFVGPVKAGLDVCHTCDNRICVNPDHLFMGTRADNMQDAKRKGRTRGAGKHLTRHQINLILVRVISGHPRSRIAKDMGIKYTTVAALCSGRSFSKITGITVGARNVE